MYGLFLGKGTQIFTILSLEKKSNHYQKEKNYIVGISGERGRSREVYEAPEEDLAVGVKQPLHIS